MTSINVNEFKKLVNKYNLMLKIYSSTNSRYPLDYVMDARLSYEPSYSAIIGLRLHNESEYKCIVYDGSGLLYNDLFMAEQFLIIELKRRKQKIIDEKLNNIKKDFK